MYTVVWTDEKGNDRYERVSSKDEVRALIKAKNLIDDDDVLIFPPEADEIALTTSDFE